MAVRSSTVLMASCLCLWLFILSGAGAENILFILFPDTGSHFQSAKPIIHMFRDAGHNVTFVKASPIKFEVESGVRVIDAQLHKIRKEDQEMFWHSTVKSYMLPHIYETADKEIHTFIDKHPEELRQLFNERWDMVIIDDLFTMYGYGFALLRRRLAERSGQPAPYILLGTSGTTLNSAAYYQTIGRNWVSTVPVFPNLPTDEHNHYDPQRFIHRAESVWENVFEFISLNIYTPFFQTTGLRRLGLLDFSWMELYEHADYIFVDYFDRLAGSPLSVGSEIINIGARCPPAGGKSLPADLAEFVDDPRSKGTVYVAFGTYADLRFAPARIVDAFVDAFNRLTDYRIIFAARGDAQKTFGKRFDNHVRILSWAPQADILAHPRTRLFITHSGLKSMKEGVCAAVPLIFLPMFAEQAHNAHWAAVARLGPILNKFALNADRIHSAAIEVLENPVRKRHAEHVRRMHVDRPLDALAAARFHIERAQRLRWRHGERARPTFLRRGQRLDAARFIGADLAAALLIVALLISSS